MGTLTKGVWGGIFTSTQILIEYSVSKQRRPGQDTAFCKTVLGLHILPMSWAFMGQILLLPGLQIKIMFIKYFSYI